MELRRWRVWTGMVWKDWRLLVTGTPTLWMVCLFSLLMLAILSFAVEPGSQAAREWAGALLWVVFWFTGEVLMSQSFEQERLRQGYTMAIAGAQTPLAFFLGKAVANFFALALVHTVTVFIFTLFFDWRWRAHGGWMAIVWVSAIVGYIAVGHILGLALLEARHRGILFPLMLFPILLGIFMVAARATTMIMHDYPPRALIQPLVILWLANLLNTLVVAWAVPRIVAE